MLNLSPSINFGGTKKWVILNIHPTSLAITPWMKWIEILFLFLMMSILEHMWHITCNELSCYVIIHVPYSCWCGNLCHVSNWSVTHLWAMPNEKCTLITGIESVQKTQIFEIFIKIIIKKKNLHSNNHHYSYNQTSIINLIPYLRKMRKRHRKIHHF